MIQDILPKKFYNQYVRQEPKLSDYICILQPGVIYVKEGDVLVLPTYAELSEYVEHGDMALQYAFSIDETAYYLCSIPAIEMEGYSFRKLFSVRSMQSRDMVFAISTAYHLFVWYSQNRYCGKCGSLLSHADRQRMLYCKACDNVVFPKLAPAVIIALTHGDKLLVTKYAGREYKRYALIAGFCEIGETAEETVEREVMEEVGLEVTGITYYKSQPWGFDSNLLLGYFCELKKEAPIRMDREELSMAEWISYKDIPEDYEELSLTMEMMQVFRQKNEISRFNR